MSLTDRINQARFDRGARRAVREQHLQLVRELSAYNTPAERLEIEMIAARTPGPEADIVLDILNDVSAGNMYRAV